MTKKHYEFIAETIRRMPDFAPNLRAQKLSCACAFAERLESLNPKFNKNTFIRACGLAGEVAYIKAK